MAGGWWLAEPLASRSNAAPERHAGSLRWRGGELDGELPTRGACSKGCFLYLELRVALLSKDRILKNGQEARRETLFNMPTVILHGSTMFSANLADLS